MDAIGVTKNVYHGPQIFIGSLNAVSLASIVDGVYYITYAGNAIPPAYVPVNTGSSLTVGTTIAAIGSIRDSTYKIAKITRVI